MAFELSPVQDAFNIEGFHAIYCFEFDQNFYHPPERHPFWELVYVDSARIEAIMEGFGCALEQGQMIFHRPMELHAHVSNKREPNNLVVVGFTCHSAAMQRLEKKICRLDPGSQKVLSLFLSEAKNALGTLRNQFHDTSPLDFSQASFGACQLMRCYLSELLIRLLRGDELSQQTLRPRKDSRRLAEHALAESMREYLDARLDTSVTLASLCAQYRISRSYACRIFREAHGQSPIDYWIAQRIRWARRLLREERYNVTEIAALLGYSGIHQFSRAFKQVTGLSPLAYKRSVIRAGMA